MTIRDETERLLGVECDAVGNKWLRRARFVKRSFPFISLGPVRDVGQKLLIEDVQFVNCHVSGEFTIGAGVVLRNVMFDSVSSRDSLTVSATAVCDHVIVRGSERHAGLWVKPDEPVEPDRDRVLREWFAHVTSTIDVMLDISECLAPEITILGYPASKVNMDPERHLRIPSEWRHLVDWKALGLGPTSYWRIRLRYLQAFGLDEGIFSLPLKSSSDYERTVQELTLITGGWRTSS